MEPMEEIEPSDLERLETVELRFAFADSDEKVQRLLNVFFCPVLDKIDSPVPQVKKKAMDICSHISKRVKSSPSLTLPLESLSTLYKTSQSRSLLNNFTMVYLETAMKRAPKDQAQKVLPELIRNISKKTKSQQALLFSFILPVLVEYTEVVDPKDKVPIVDPLQIVNSVSDCSFLFDRFTDMMLFSIHSQTKTGPTDKQTTDNTTVKVNIPDGLSPQSITLLLNGKNPSWSTNPQELSKFKVGIIKLLMLKSVFPDTLLPNQKFMVFLAGCSDLNHQVVSLSEDGIKRYSSPDHESQDLVERLYHHYLGSRDSPPNPETNRTEGSHSMKLKSINHLLKSKQSTEYLNVGYYTQIIISSMFGTREAVPHPKLRNSGVALLQWISNMVNLIQLFIKASDSSIQAAHDILFKAVSKFIDGYSGTDEPSLGVAFLCVGLLVKRVPDIIKAQPNIMKDFFSQLTTNNKNNRVYIRQAMVMMIESFKTILSDEPAVPYNVLSYYIRHSEPQARYVAARYAHSIFPFANVFALLICLAGSGDLNSEVKEESLTGLAFPDFSKTPNGTEYIKLIPELNVFYGAVTMLYDMALEAHIPGVKYLGSFTIGSFTVLLEFIRGLIIKHADPSAVVTLGHEFKDTRILQSTTSLNALRSFLDTQAVESPSNLGNYLNFLQIGLTHSQTDGVLQHIASAYLLDLARSSEKFSRLFLCNDSFLSWFQPLLFTYQFETRSNIAHTLGIILTLNNIPFIQSKSKSICQDLYSNIGSDVTFETKQGSLIALVYILSRVILRYPSTWTTFISEQMTQDIIQQVGIYLEKDPLSISISLSELGRAYPIPLSILNQLEKIIKTSKDPKIIESLIFAYGSCFISENKKERVDFLVSLDYSKSIDTLFTIGDALSTLITGWEADHMIRFKDFEFQVEKKPDTELLLYVLDKCFEASDASLVKRKAVSVFLVCVSGRCRSFISMEYIDKLHQSFLGFLSDKDVASRGIGLSYDLANVELKQKFIQSLSTVIRIGRHNVDSGLVVGSQDTKETKETKDSKETKVSVDSSSLTPFQSILSLASEMNQPDLVYKLIYLTTQNPIWTLRNTGILDFSWNGFESVPDSILPKIWRMQYDPSMKIAHAMQSVWKKIQRPIPFPIQIQELINGTRDKSWTTRESSLIGLCEFIPSMNLVLSTSYLTDLWKACERASDDIRESVRLMGVKACSVLRKQIMTWCDIDANLIGDTLIPFFIMSPVNADILVKLVRKIGKRVSSHVEKVVPYLIESMISNTTLNYAQMHVGTETQGLINTYRNKAVVSSEKMDAIYQCISYSTNINSLIEYIVSCKGGSEVQIAVSLSIQQSSQLGTIEKADSIILKFRDDPFVISSLFKHLLRKKAFLDGLRERMYLNDTSLIYYELIKKNRDILVSEWSREILLVLVYGLNFDIKSWEPCFDLFGIPVSSHIEYLCNEFMIILGRPEYQVKSCIGKCFSFISGHVKNRELLTLIASSLACKTFQGKEDLVKGYIDLCFRLKVGDEYCMILIRELAKQDSEYFLKIVGMICQCVVDCCWDSKVEEVKEIVSKRLEFDEAKKGLSVLEKRINEQMKE